MIPTMTALKRSSNVTYEVLDGQAVILDEGGEAVITLNAVGTQVWEAIDGNRDVDAIVEHLAGMFTGISHSQLRADVEAFVAELRADKLVDDDAS